MRYLAKILNALPILIDRFILGKNNKKKFWYYFRSVSVLVIFAIFPIVLFISFFKNLNIFIEYLLMIITLVEIPLFIKLVALGSEKAQSLLVINPYVSMILLGLNTGSSIFIPLNRICQFISKGDSLVWWLICIIILIFNNKDYSIKKVKNNIEKYS